MKSGVFPCFVYKDEELVLDGAGGGIVDIVGLIFFLFFFLFLFFLFFLFLNILGFVVDNVFFLVCLYVSLLFFGSLCLCCCC